jgi:hypothetical protein
MKKERQKYEETAEGSEREKNSDTNKRRKIDRSTKTKLKE